MTKEEKKAKIEEVIKNNAIELLFETEEEGIIILNDILSKNLNFYAIGESIKINKNGQTILQINYIHEDNEETINCTITIVEQFLNIN